MKKFLFAALASTFATASVQAITVLYSTDFEAPTYADGGIIGQDSWVITGTSVVSPIAVANTASNGTVTLANTGQDVRRLFTPAVTAGSVFLKVDITVAAAGVAGDYFIHLGDGGTSNFYDRVYVRSSGAGFVMALSTSSGAVTYGTDVLTLGTTYTIVARYDINAGTTNDSGALFINPTTIDGSADTAYVAATLIGVDAISIASVSLRQGGGSGAPGVTLDNLSVFTVPEPATAFLGGLGLLGLLRRRRCN